MKTKKSAGMSVYIFILLAANLVLAFFVGRSVLAEKLPDGLSSLRKDAGSAVTADTRSDRPKLSEFTDWYYAKAIIYGMPDQYENMNTRQEAYGSWKATICRDRNDIDKESYLLLNIDITGEGDDMNVVIDWYDCYKIKSHKTTDETAKKDTVLSASWVDGAIAVDCDGFKFTIPYLYYIGDKAYGMGKGTMNRHKIEIGLVRDR